MAIILTVGGVLLYSPGNVAQAKELTNTVQSIPVDAYSLLAWEQTGSGYQQIVRPLENGRIDFNYTGASTVRFAMQLELRNYDFSLDDYYGNLEALSVLIRLKFRVVYDSNVYSGSKPVFDGIGSVALYVPGSPAQLASSSYSYVMTPVDDASSYDCELTLTAKPATLDAFDAGNLSLFISGANFLIPFVEDPAVGSYLSQIVVQPFVGTVEFEYYRDTVGDVINNNLEDLNESLNDGKDQYESAPGDLDSGSSDMVEAGQDALDAMDKFDQSWQDSVQGIYDAIPNARDPLEQLHPGLIMEQASGTVVSRLWSELESVPAVYIFIMAGLLMVCVFFFLRR